MLEPLAKHYGAKLSVLCSELAAPIYENNPNVSDIQTFDRGRAQQDVAYLAALIERLGQSDADLLINSVFSRDTFSDLISAACRADKKIGFYGDLCNQSDEQRKNHTAVYSSVISSEKIALPELRRHKEFLEGLGIPASDLRPVINLTPEESSFAEEFYANHSLDPARTLVIGPISQHGIKNYPHWTKVLTDLCELDGFSLLVLGASSDRAESTRILRNIPGKHVIACGETSLRQSASLISKGRCVLAVDTSIPHIAAALGVPNVVVLGGGHFGRFFPYSSLTSVVCLPLECYGCSWGCRFSEPHCITGIHPQVVAEAVRNTIKAKSNKPRVFMQGQSLWKAQVPRMQSFEKLLDPSTIELILVDAMAT
jgi:ADP-heptose:LPS heptosyltransferase